MKSALLFVETEQYLCHTRRLVVAGKQISRWLDLVGGRLNFEFSGHATE